MADTKFYRHPEYRANVADWIRYNDMTRGRHDVMVSDRYLPRLTHEQKTGAGYEASQKLRTGREARTRYLKVPEMVISLWTSFFFIRPPALDAETKTFLERTQIEQNADGEGNGWLKFWRDQVFWSYMRDGKVGVLAESPSNEARSLGDQVDRGLRPYLRCVEALSLVDWSRETEDAARSDRFNFFRRQYEAIPPRDAKTKPVIEQRTELHAIEGSSYTISTYKRESTYSDMGDSEESDGWSPLKSANVTGLSEIPFIIFEDSESWIDGVCEETLRFHHLRSSMDNILHEQGYQLRYATGIDHNNKDQIAAISENTVVLLPQGGSFGSIQNADIGGYERQCADALANAFKVGLNQFRQLPADSRVAQSEETMIEEKVNTLALVLSTLDDLEESMTKSNEMLAQYAGQKNFKGRVTFDREGIKRNLPRFIEVAQAFGDRYSKYPGVSKMLDKQAVRVLDLPDEDQQEALDEIDKAIEERLSRPTFAESEDDGDEEAITAPA